MDREPQYFGRDGAAVTADGRDGTAIALRGRDAGNDHSQDEDTAPRTHHLSIAACSAVRQNCFGFTPAVSNSTEDEARVCPYFLGLGLSYACPCPCPYTKFRQLSERPADRTA